MSRSRSSLRVALVALTLPLLGSLLVAPGAAGSTPARSSAPAPSSYAVATTDRADAATTAPREAHPRAARQAKKTYRCGGWTWWPFGDDDEQTQVRSCVNITRATRQSEVYHRAQFFNHYYDQSAPFICASSTEKKYTFSASVSGEAEQDLVFAKFKVSVTVSASYEISTKEEESIRARVKPRSYAHCKRGMVGYKVTGTRRSEFRSRPEGSPGPWSHRRKGATSYTAYVPSTLTYEVGPGRA